MKTIKFIFLSLLLVSVAAFRGFCQTDDIVADSGPFQYLIGKKYFNPSELGDFKWIASVGTIFNKGLKIGNTDLLSGNQQIITSEFIEEDSISTNEIHKIADIVVLNGHFKISYACLTPKNENTEIMTVHSWEEREMNENTILAAFEINFKTGKFRKVNPKKFKREEGKNLD